MGSAPVGRATVRPGEGIASARRHGSEVESSEWRRRDLLQRSDSAVDVLLAAQRADAEPDRSVLLRPELLVHEWRALQSGAHRNVVIDIEELSDIVRLPSRKVAAEHADVGAQRVRAV